MTMNSVTVELAPETAEQLDRLARQRGVSRAEAIAAVVTQAVERDRQDAPTDAASIRERLAGPLRAQDAFLEHASVGDEWRSF